MPLAEKRIIITGASGGIGLACARLAAQQGAKVVMASRNAAKLQSAAAGLNLMPEQILSIPCDVTSESQVRQLFKQTKTAWGGVDGLINCAAVFAKAPFALLALDTWQQVLATNLTGTFLCCREAFRAMSGGGVIVNLASLSGVPGVEKFPGFAAYNVSKYGVVGLTEILAVEGQSLGIRCNCISPAAVATPMLAQAAPQLPPAMQPDEVAQAAMFLLSEASSAMNGANLILTGAPKGGKA